MIPHITCYRCRGAFTANMTQEKKNGHVYHAFCLDKERRVDEGLDPEIHPTEHDTPERNKWGFPSLWNQVDSFFDQ